MKYPIRYVPFKLSKSNTIKQASLIKKSKKKYKLGNYYVREKINSFKSKPSKHVRKAMKTYKINSILPSKKLSKATGCSLTTLKKIVRKGEGAYFSSGSRPSQTPQSWGIARLASSLTGGKSAAVDFSLLREGCNHKKRAYKFALKSVKKYKTGHSSTKHRKLKN
jgi:hypothetical protein